MAFESMRRDANQRLMWFEFQRQMEEAQTKTVVPRTLLSISKLRVQHDWYFENFEQNDAFLVLFDLMHRGITPLKISYISKNQ